MAAQIADEVLREAQAACRVALLPVEDAGDGGVGVVLGQAPTKPMVSSSVRTVAGRERGKLTSNSLSVPPRQRSFRWRGLLAGTR